MDWLNNITTALQNNAVNNVKAKRELMQLVNDSDLETYWQRNSTSENVLHVSDIFHNNYIQHSELELNKDELNDIIKQYEILIDCVGKLNAAYHIKHIKVDIEDSNEKEKYYSKVTYTQVHLNRLIYQCNQLIFRRQHEENNILYRKLHKESKTSNWLAIGVAAASFVLALGSICRTNYYGKRSDESSNKIIKKIENCCPKYTTSPQKTLNPFWGNGEAISSKYIFPFQNTQECTDDNSDKKNK